MAETGVGAFLGSEVEALRWDPWQESNFYVSLENGLVLRTLPSNLDQSSQARFTLSADDGATSAIDVNPHFKGCIATGGADKQVKIWDVGEDSSLVTWSGQSVFDNVFTRRSSHACSCRFSKSGTLVLERRLDLKSEPLVERFGKEKRRKLVAVVLSAFKDDEEDGGEEE